MGEIAQIRANWKYLADAGEYGAAAKLWLESMQLQGGSIITNKYNIGDDGRPIDISHALVAIARCKGYSK